MKETTPLPPDIAERVVAVGSVVSPADVDTYRQIREIEDRSHKIRTVIDAWSGQQSEDRIMRSMYAKWILIGLSIQALAVNTAFFLIGYGLITVNKWVASTFVMAVFGELAAMALIVLKYLFPKASAEVLGIIEKL